MPSVPLVNELGNNAAKFQNLVDSTATQPTEKFKGLTTFTEADNDEMFQQGDTKIFIRVRPVLPHEAATNNRVPVVRSIEGVEDAVFMAPKITLSGACSLDQTSVKVNRTFSSTDDTKKVYDTAGKQLLDMAVNGASTTIICYGQTGSGKTFTTTGFLEWMAKDLGHHAVESVDISVVAIEIKDSGCTDLLTGEEVQVCEDLKGEMHLLGAKEIPVASAEEVKQVYSVAVAARATKATERNAGSSRSHMVIRFIMRRKDCAWASPGLFVLADLAGSESTADSAKHDKERVNETKFINSSLMTLKDCIRSRANATSSAKHVHIPYRRCKLTMLLRDSFELAVKRPTKTVVIATVSPLLQDVRHTAGTLRYASMLVVAPASTVLKSDPNDPTNWDREKCLGFLVTSSKNILKTPELLLTEGDGRAMVQIPEAEFIRRATNDCNMGEKQAKMLYNAVWKVMIDARTKSRNAVLKAKPQDVLKTKPQDQAAAPTAAPPAKRDVISNEREVARRPSVRQSVGPRSPLPEMQFDNVTPNQREEIKPVVRRAPPQVRQTQVGKKNPLPEMEF